MSDSRPQFSEIDAWGATHRGHVRKDNQDCFFAGALISFLVKSGSFSVTFAGSGGSRFSGLRSCAMPGFAKRAAAATEPKSSFLYVIHPTVCAAGSKARAAASYAIFPSSPRSRLTRA